MIEYENFKDMKDNNPELAERLLDTVGEGDWQDYQLVCYEDSSESKSPAKGVLDHLDNYPEQANKPLDQWDYNDFAAVGMSQHYTGGDGTRLSFDEAAQANRLIAKMIPKIIKRGVESGKSTSDIMQEVYELADKDYAMRQSGVASLEALIERERTAVQQSKNSSTEPETY